MTNIAFNPEVRLIISDVDQTIADLYCDIAPEMASALATLLREGRVLLLITGQGVDGIQRRVVEYLPSELRHRVLIGHCSGAEVYAFDHSGNREREPLYSRYAELEQPTREAWRIVINILLDEFQLRALPTMPIPEFRSLTQDDPHAIMLDDRGPQITFDMPNSYELTSSHSARETLPNHLSRAAYDLRLPIAARATQLLEQHDVPATPRLAGEFAIDFALRGVSKTTAVQLVLQHPVLYELLDMSPESLDPVRHVEVWGDKFSVHRGGTDRHMSEALPPAVRSIDFRDESPDELPSGWNIVFWNGTERLERGALEYLRSR